jgi:hypothetical protein
VLNPNDESGRDEPVGQFPQGGYGRGRGQPQSASHSNQSSKNVMYSKKAQSHNQKAGALKKEGAPKF